MKYSRCIECKYDFRGHTDVVRCPECGLVYDLSTIKIPLRRRGGLGELVFVYAVICALPIVAFGLMSLGGDDLSRQFASERLANNWARLLLAVVVLVLFFVVRRVLRRWFPEELQLSDQGLEFVRRRKRKVLPWRKIRSARVWPSRFGPPCIRLIPRGFVRCDIGGVFLDLGVSKPQTRLVLQYIQDAMQDSRDDEGTAR